MSYIAEVAWECECGQRGGANVNNSPQIHVNVNDFAFSMSLCSMRVFELVNPKQAKDKIEKKLKLKINDL